MRFLVDHGMRFNEPVSRTESWDKPASYGRLHKLMVETASMHFINAAPNEVPESDIG